jgi:hypothetical protein
MFELRLLHYNQRRLAKGAREGFTIDSWTTNYSLKVSIREYTNRGLGYKLKMLAIIIINPKLQTTDS